MCHGTVQCICIVLPNSSSLETSSVELMGDVSEDNTVVLKGDNTALDDTWVLTNTVALLEVDVLADDTFNEMVDIVADISGDDTRLDDTWVLTITLPEVDVFVGGITWLCSGIIKVDVTQLPDGEANCVPEDDTEHNAQETNI